MEYYELTENVEYILESIYIPFSFVLIDLYLHNTHYKAYIVIQPYESEKYMVLNDTKLMITKTNPLIVEDEINIEKRSLLTTGVYCISLFHKVSSIWVYNGFLMSMKTPPPFYYTDRLYIVESLTTTKIQLESLKEFFTTTYNSEKINGNMPERLIETKMKLLKDKNNNNAHFLLKILLETNEEFENIESSLNNYIFFNYKVLNKLTKESFDRKYHTENRKFIQKYLLIDPKIRYYNQFLIIDILALEYHTYLYP
jgi:hypothetical protein